MQSKKQESVRALIVLDEEGRIAFHTGEEIDPRLRSMLSDPEWVAEAEVRRIVPITLTNSRFTVLLCPIKSGHLILVFDEPSETVLNFFMSVDFAFDILNHLLSDPYDAMMVIDEKEQLVFVSPIHEKFFGFRSGDAIGRNVRDVVENTRLHHVVRTGVAEVGHIQKMRGKERVVSRHPIWHDGQIVGAIGRVMFKGPQQLEALSRRINMLEREIATYKHEANELRQGEVFLNAIVGESAAIKSVRDQIRKIAPLDIPVLVQGESGTGKELVAQALHMMSPRHKARLVTVNAAALPAALVESELFGYEAGSFTGADRKGRVGKFELADKGTIFLDEIGDMPLEVQSKLLRVLQDKMVERVGGNKAVQVDFRLCSATNRNLAQFVEEGKFRLDLYYRISPVVITMPPLCERVEDIPLLMDHFLKGLAEQYDRPIPEVDANVHDFLMNRSWPGNVRELRHLMERAVVFCENNRLRITDFQTVANQPGSTSFKVPEPGPETDMSDGGVLKDAIATLENKLILDAMARFGGNKKKVAEHLGVSRSYLYKKLGQ